MSIGPLTRLAVVQSHLRRNADRGIECPACHQHFKRYHRRFNRGMAESLVEMYWHGNKNWIYVPDSTSRRGREEGKLVHWGLVEFHGGRKKNGTLNGFARVTKKGEMFVQGRIPIRERIILVNNVLEGREGELIYIKNVLDGFNYWELIGS